MPKNQVEKGPAAKAWQWLRQSFEVHFFKWVATGVFGAVGTAALWFREHLNVWYDVIGWWLFGAPVLSSLLTLGIVGAVSAWRSRTPRSRYRWDEHGGILWKINYPSYSADKPSSVEARCPRDRTPLRREDIPFSEHQGRRGYLLSKPYRWRCLTCLGQGRDGNFEPTLLAEMNADDLQEYMLNHFIGIIDSGEWRKRYRRYR